MFTSTLPFPAGPQSADRTIIKPSKAFKKRVINVIAAISLFFVTYLTLVAAAIVIAILGCIAGVAVISAHASFLTLVLGLGLMGSGIMLVYFVIKFIFKRNRIDYSGMLEITAEDSPQLFEFIQKITKEVGAPMPKHVYLSDNVNASVFYDSTFWSMFLPVRKNLIIGLGLVNGLNLSEFKAVIAHEFGHFSQRSMKFGSYVYHLNNIVHSMLYDNDSYHTIINQIARLHMVLRFTAYLNIWIVRGMQYILRKVYVVLNKSHLGLSREMEFHADSIAAYVSGSNNAIASLQRVEVADTCYATVLELLNGEIKQKNKIVNLYQLQSNLLKSQAGVLTFDESSSANHNKGSDQRLYLTQVEIDDPWSSHPTNTQREAHLKHLNIYAAPMIEPAWLLFNQAEEIQEQMTELLYTNAHITEKLETKNIEYFTELHLKQIAIGSGFDEIYNGYYDYRKIAAFDVESLTERGIESEYTELHQLFSTDHCNLQKRIEALEQDISTLATVVDNNNIYSFRFNNIQHTRNGAETIKKQLDDELQVTRAKLMALDQQVFSFIYHKLSDEGREQLAAAYTNYFAHQHITQQDVNCYADMMEYVQATAKKRSVKEAEELVDKLYQAEIPVKQRLAEMLSSEEYGSIIKGEIKTNITNYLSQKWTYFHHNTYDMVSFNLCKSALANYLHIAIEKDYAEKKRLLHLQLQLLEENN